MPVGKGVFIDLRLDIDLLDPRECAQLGDLYLVVEVPDVADDRLISHLFHVLKGNNIDVTGRRYEDIRPLERLFDGRDFCLPWPLAKRRWILISVR